MTNTLRPDIPDDELEDYLEFLDDLRESGATNMFGAASWLENNYGISRDLAKQVLLYWMDTFGKRHEDKEESNV